MNHTIYRINKNYNIICGRQEIKEIKIINLDKKKENNSKKKETDSLKPETNSLKIISWNIEDFTKIDNIYKSDIFAKLKDCDIILIQEWKVDKGDNFVKELNKPINKFNYNNVDRTAVIYNSNIFNYNEIILYDIKLIYEPPTLFEKLYTPGREKSNLMIKLVPKDNTKSIIYVVSFHLSAYIAESHQDFHKKQLTCLLNNCYKIINNNIKNENKNYDIIIGGDTNYRTKNNNKKLINLIDKSIINKFKSKNKILENICNGTCNSIPTQSFTCMHEKQPAKMIYSLYKKTQERIIRSNDDARIDFIVSSLTKKENAIIDNYCKLSDHKPIRVILNW